MRFSLDQFTKIIANYFDLRIITRSADGEDVTAGAAEAEEERAMEEAVTTVAMRVEVAFISAAAYSLKIAVDLRDGGNPTNPQSPDLDFDFRPSQPSKSRRYYLIFFASK